MITFRFDGQNFHLLVPIFPGQTSTAENWSRMRWIVVGPAEQDRLIESLHPANQSALGSDRSSMTIDFDDVQRDMRGRGINMGHLDMLWNLIALDLMTSKLWSKKLEMICAEEPFANWIYPRIEEIHRPLIDDFLRKKSESPSSVSSKILEDQLQASLLEAYVPPPQRIRELVTEILAHVRWLSVERFASQVNFDSDVFVASIWLGPKFNEFLCSGHPHDLRLG